MPQRKFLVATWILVFDFEFFIGGRCLRSSIDYCVLLVDSRNCPVFSLEFDCIDSHLFGPVGCLDSPVAVGLYHTGWGGTWNVRGMAVVSGDDPKLTGLRANTEVCFVEGPVDFLGPFAPIASAVDGMEDDLHSFFG